MYKTGIILSALISIFAFASCNKNEARLANVDALAGTWNWTSTHGGISNNIQETPQTTGKTLKFQVTADNKYKLIENGTVIEEGAYTIETRKCIHDGEMKSMIRFSDSKLRMIEEMTNASLQLSDESNDGIFINFTKETSK